MASLRLVLRNLFRKGQNTMAKVLTLCLGLTFGLVLIAKVYFEGSYNTHYPDNERIFLVSQVMTKYEENKEYHQVSGGVVTQLKEMNPEIEECTRFTYFAENRYFTDAGTNKKYEGTGILADTNLFKVLPRPMITGNAEDILSKPMQAIISRSLAAKIGTETIGKMISFDFNPKAKFMLAGIFEDLPENTTYKYDIILSMSSISHFMGDGSENLMGNDRYIGFIKSHSGVVPEELEKKVQQNVQEYIPDDVKEEFKRSGFKYTLTINSLNRIHEANESVYQLKLILLFLAILLIVTSTMNYLLLVISVIINRAKQVAVYKCYGAGRRELTAIAMTESFVYLLMAIALGLIFLLAMQGQIVSLLNVSMKALFLSKGMIFILFTVLMIYLLSGLITTVFYKEIPVASAFRNLKVNKKVWKLILLFTQFIAIGTLLPLLFIVNKQYNYMVTDSPGYNYENLAYMRINRIDSLTYKTMINELNSLPEVNDVTASCQLPFRWSSGNNIQMLNNTDELFNVSDYYFTNSNFFALMEIPLLEGTTFSGGNDQIMVDRNFVNKMREIGKWDNGSAIGKSFFVTGHGGPFTICGVYENFRMGTINRQDNRPSIMFPEYKKYIPDYLVIKYNQVSQESLIKTNDLVNRLIPDQVNNIILWKTEMIHLYANFYRFRNSISIGFIASFLIVIIGLIGYLQDELNRRRKEIAIRIINGAEKSSIFMLYLVDILKLALPSLLVGVIIANGISRRWLEQFSEKISPEWWIFAICVIFIIGFLIIVVAYNIWKATRANPIESLKAE